MTEDAIPGVEVRGHDGPGYLPLIESGGDWMAALMNGTKDSWSVPDIMEQHPDTDELFVLVSGRAYMIVAGNGPMPGKIVQREMKRNVLYNVKAGTWHINPMTRDATFVIIEKTGTNINGSVVVDLSEEQKRTIEIRGGNP
jgi:mannose-6-phosphate isomerase-like protein (cupin superfamily)